VTVEENSFVGYYSKHEISPVNQDLSDIEKHFSRRDSLFRTLGLPPSLLSEKSILEFGPGSGHNAIHIASLKPSKYVLVEGNKTGFCETQERLNRFDNLNFEIFNEDFTSFNTTEDFDVVWAEGCLPFQNDPTSTLKHTANFVKHGGILTITTVDEISYYSENIRRLLKYRFFPDIDEDIQKACEELTPVYEKHLTHLQGMSRSIKDWIFDSILQSLRRPLPIPKSILTLKADFDAFSSSPCFITDWRWYKEITGRNRKFNENFIDQYYKNNLNLLDYRSTIDPHHIDFGKKLEKICNESYEISLQIEMGKEDLWDDFFECSSALGDHIKDQAPITYLSIREAITMLRNGDLGMELKYFPPWWGRGQQYLSLIRKELKV
tara:strand:- start:1610 stop:2746 length:1137 start_codon:yes stop_codon:yes gene_type:complete